MFCVDIIGLTPQRQSGDLTVISLDDHLVGIINTLPFILTGTTSHVDVLCAACPACCGLRSDIQRSRLRCLKPNCRVPGVTNFIDCKLIVRREAHLGFGKQGLYLAASNPSLRPQSEMQISLRRRLDAYQELIAEIKLSEGCPVGPALLGYVMVLEYLRLAPFQASNEIVAIHKLESEWCAPFLHIRELAATYPQLSFDMTYCGADEGFYGCVVAREGEPPRVYQRPFRLSHAASFCSSSMA
jgi:hypothetical protein